MAKKAMGKEAKRPAVSAPKHVKRKYDKHVLVIGILLIVLGTALYFSLNKAPAKGVLATVNGQQITTEDVQLVYKFLPDNEKASATQEPLLNQTIDETLLQQDAQKRGIAASSEEISKALQDAISRSGQSQQDVEKFLARRNVTSQDLSAFFKKQVIFSKLVKQVPELQVTVTEQEMKAFYDQNKAQITTPYDAAKDQIRDYLKNNKLSLAFNTYLAKLRAQSSIKIVKQ